MPLTATTPTVVSATYNQWAFQVQSRGYGCAPFGSSVVPPIALTLGLRKCRVRDDGVPELSPLDGPSDFQVVEIPDLLQLATLRPDVAAAIAALTAAVGSFAADQGLI